MKFHIGQTYTFAECIKFERGLTPKQYATNLKWLKNLWAMTTQEGIWYYPNAKMSFAKVPGGWKCIQKGNAQTPTMTTNNIAFISDLYSAKYNQSEAVAAATLEGIIATPHKCASLVIPESLLGQLPPDWQRTNLGQAYLEQGLTENAWIVSHKAEEA